MATDKERLRDGAVYATTELLKHEYFVGQFYLVARQDDGITNTLVANGNAVFHTSNDFFTYDCAYPHVIGEVPPAAIENYVRRALTVAFGKVAFLIPINFVLTAKAKALFEETPLARMYMLTRRISLRPSSMVWCVWEKGYFLSPIIRWI